MPKLTAVYNINLPRSITIQHPYSEESFNKASLNNRQINFEHSFKVVINRFDVETKFVGRKGSGGHDDEIEWYEVSELQITVIGNEDKTIHDLDDKQVKQSYFQEREKSYDMAAFEAANRLGVFAYSPEKPR